MHLAVSAVSAADADENPGFPVSGSKPETTGVTAEEESTQNDSSSGGGGHGGGEGTAGGGGSGGGSGGKGKP